MSLILIINYFFITFYPVSPLGEIQFSAYKKIDVSMLRCVANTETEVCANPAHSGPNMSHTTMDDIIATSKTVIISGFHQLPKNSKNWYSPCYMLVIMWWTSLNPRWCCAILSEMEVYALGGFNLKLTQSLLLVVIAGWEAFNLLICHRDTYRKEYHSGLLKASKVIDNIEILLSERSNFSQICRAVSSRHTLLGSLLRVLEHTVIDVGKYKVVRTLNALIAALFTILNFVHMIRKAMKSKIRKSSCPKKSCEVGTTWASILIGVARPCFELILYSESHNGYKVPFVLPTGAMLRVAIGDLMGGVAVKFGKVLDESGSIGLISEIVIVSYVQEDILLTNNEQDHCRCKQLWAVDPLASLTINLCKRLTWNRTMPSPVLSKHQIKVGCSKLIFERLLKDDNKISVFEILISNSKQC